MNKNAVLPNYVVINDESLSPALRNILRMPATPFSFPLNDEDKHTLNTLEQKFDAEANCAGLAAPQIGFSRQAIIFAVPDNPKLRATRADFDQTMNKSLWLNPSYEGIGDEKFIDFEGCFSVRDLAGPVSRFKTIRYQFYTLEGIQKNGEASGFLARVIQHEIDHLNGILFIDLVPEHELISAAEYQNRQHERNVNP